MTNVPRGESKRISQEAAIMANASNTDISFSRSYILGRAVYKAKAGFRKRC